MNPRLRQTPGIYLVGFMGSGKTTAGKRLAEELGWSFVDIDDDIEARVGMPIAQIFDQQGEQEFRRMESEAIAARVKQIHGSQPMVVALGGGAFVQEHNTSLLASSGITIWLDCPLEKVIERVGKAENRPLARDREAFEKLYHARRQGYRKADYRIAITSDDPAVAVKEILEIPGLWR
ncbi:MAG: shikimate kinase [Acidobacteria bacterium]|nr:shikimate kinase [Acidobacteriota bacterium]